MSSTTDIAKTHGAHGTRGAGAATKLILASSLGNALEFYEILVYGYFAAVIAKVFFPLADEAVSLLITLAAGKNTLEMTAAK